MKDNYDFSDAVKNPFAGKLKNGYTITVFYENDNQKSKPEKPNRNYVLRKKNVRRIISRG